jgi:G:T/U-mismatch repair DNA glycosylase
MVKNIIPKENIAQVEEVRELENKDLAQQSEQQQKKSEEKSTITENVKEAVLPVAHASDEEKKEGARQAIGYTLGGIDAINPAAGGVVSSVTTIGGGIEEGIGKLTGNEEMAEGGKVVSQSALQPLKDLGKGIKKIFE